MLLLCLITQSLAFSFSFLQEPLTSDGEIAEGLTTITSDLSSYSSNLDSSLSDLNAKIDSTIEISAQIGSDLLDSQISSTKLELSVATGQISDLTKKLSLKYNFCKRISKCSSCVLNSNCIWCASAAECMPGDNLGAFNSACEDWSYRDCSFNECSDFESCEGCVASEACGWCELRQECLGNIGSCPSTFYYEYPQVCPYSSDQEDVVEYPVLMPTTDKDWAELKELREKVQGLNMVIEGLYKDKEQVLLQSKDGLDRKIERVQTDSDLGYLVQIVDQLRIQEMDARKEVNAEIQENMREETASAIQNESSSNKEEILNNIESEYMELNRTAEEVGQSIEERLVPIADSLEDLRQSIDIIIKDRKNPSKTNDTDISEGDSGQVKDNTSDNQTD